MAFHANCFAFAPPCPAHFTSIPPSQFSSIAASIQSAATQIPTGIGSAPHAAEENPPHPVFPLHSTLILSPRRLFLSPRTLFFRPPSPSKTRQISRAELKIRLRCNKITLRRRGIGVLNDKNRVRRDQNRLRIVKTRQLGNKIIVRRDVSSLRSHFDTQNLQNHKNGGSTTNRH